MALEPLAVLAAVCAPDCKDALSLPLHPLLKQVRNSREHDVEPGRGFACWGVP